VAGHDGLISTKEVRHLVECQPDRLVFKPHVERCLAVVGPIEDDFATVQVSGFHPLRSSMRLDDARVERDAGMRHALREVAPA
jgi:hypothetical protein